LASSKNAKIAVVLVGALVLAALVTLLIYSTGGESLDAPGSKADLEIAHPSEDVLEKRGPRPDDSHLRGSAERVRDPDAALEMARQNLDEVNREIEGASDPDQRARLERKKAMVEDTIGRLVGKEP
jgi:hypothetical protein